jgi:queuine tRNA-ribosyltransferase
LNQILSISLLGPRLALAAGLPGSALRHSDHSPFDCFNNIFRLAHTHEITWLVRRGVDMFDCVIPTREARHGRLYVYKKLNIPPARRAGKNKKLNANFYEVVNILNSKYKKDTKSLDKNCACELCQNYSAGYLHHLFKAGEPLALRLATLHNINFYLKLMENIKHQIENQKI